MTIQRYRPKPKPGDREVQYAARYEPGQPLDDLIAVARKADSRAELAEVTFPSGTVLIVRWTRVPDDRPSEPEYEIIEAGKYLGYSPGNDFLYDADDANWRQFYDLVTENLWSKPKTLRARIAYRLRCWADRIDHAGAPKAMSVSFTFEDRVGIVFRDDRKGCPLWYYGDEGYERAHSESGPVLGERSTAWLPRRKAPAWPGADIPVASFTVRLGGDLTRGDRPR